jgi:XapX domain-containing protein
VRTCGGILFIAFVSYGVCHDYDNHESGDVSRYAGPYGWVCARLTRAVKIYLASAATGLLVGIIYALLGVRSPAPPIVALFGLLGMLLGEQVVPLAKRLMTSQSVDMMWWRHEAQPHVFGKLPTGRSARLSGGAPQRHDTSPPSVREN